MENTYFIEMAHGSANTVTEVQKEAIRVAILQAIGNGSYLERLELLACQAISNINKYSDAESISETIELSKN